MAQATTYPFSQFLIKIGDGATVPGPEVFTDPCGLTSKGFTRTANLNDTNVPDCDDPDAPSWLGRDVVSYQAAIAGSGVVAAESVETWEEWWLSGETRNVRIELGNPVEYAWIMPAKLQEYAITGERGDKAQMTVALVSDGAVVPVTLAGLAVTERTEGEHTDDIEPRRGGLRRSALRPEPRRPDEARL